MAMEHMQEIPVVYVPAEMMMVYDDYCYSGITAVSRALMSPETLRPSCMLAASWQASVSRFTTFFSS